MDDVVIVAKDKETATQYKEKLVRYLKEKLNLDANMDKTKTFPINQGINTIGFKIYTTHRLLRDDCKRKIKRKIKAMPNMVNNKNISIDKCNELLNAWKAHADNASSRNFVNQLLKKYDYLFEHKGKITLKTKVKKT